MTMRRGQVRGPLAKVTPEHDCPVCGTPAGQWCRILGGGTPWQHDARPASSWEPRR